MMQLFLGDEVTLVMDFEPTPTFVTGQVSGVILDNNKEVKRIYIQGMTQAFNLKDGWKFVDYTEEETDDEI
jgi:hypothetical protein